MTSRDKSPGRGLAPSLAVALTLAVAGCATTAPAPPGPISSGDPRPEPQPRSQAPVDREPVEELAEADGEEAKPQPTDDGFTPPHMVGREIQRAAVLLPFTHPNRSVRDDAQSLLAAIELALFELGDNEFLLMPKDTGGAPAGARKAAEEALAERADVIIGPLFSANVAAVSEVVNAAYDASGGPQQESAPGRIRADDPLAFLFEDFEEEPAEPSARADGLRQGPVPVIAFSNDVSAAEGGALLASISPEEEAARIVEYAARQGVDRFAFLGPRSTYGERIEAALRKEAARQGGFVIASGFYDPSNDSPVDEAKIVADAVKREIRPNSSGAAAAPPRVGVLVPERGVKLRAVAPLLPYYGVDTRRIVMLGTGAWNDSAVWREPTLIGGYFPAPSPEDIAEFESDYRRIYSAAPRGLASLGYDAAATAIVLARQDELSREGALSPDGFRGVNGLFRYRDDGTAERALSVLQIQPSAGAVEVERGREVFDDPPAG